MYEKMKARVNWPITILLFVGLLTIAFPLYMTIVIAFKQPTEMTNSISGILSLPAHWSLSNFAQAMEPSFKSGSRYTAARWCGFSP